MNLQRGALFSNKRCAKVLSSFFAPTVSAFPVAGLLRRF